LKGQGLQPILEKYNVREGFTDHMLQNNEIGCVKLLDNMLNVKIAKSQIQTHSVSTRIFINKSYMANRTIYSDFCNLYKRGQNTDI
jgi:hypothetical protein